MENLFWRLFAADEDYWKKVSHQHLRTKVVSLLDKFEDEDQTSDLIKYEILGIIFSISLKIYGKTK